MILYARIPKRKPKLKPKAEREQYEMWLKSHQSTKPIKAKISNVLTGYKLSVPPGRDTKHIPSLDTGMGNATKAEPKVYTGDKVLGIATLHKSNAVPVFNSQEAIDISSMRR